MTRDKQLQHRAGLLIEVTRRRHRLGHTTRIEESSRVQRISLAHYRMQHAAGATDYPQSL